MAPVATRLAEIACPEQQPVRRARRAPASLGEFTRRLLFYRGVEAYGASQEDLHEFFF